MRKVSNEKKDAFIKDYEKNIFRMLMVLGYDRSESAALMKMYHKQILKMAGNNPSNGSIVTAEMAARIIKQETKDS